MYEVQLDKKSPTELFRAAAVWSREPGTSLLDTSVGAQNNQARFAHSTLFLSFQASSMRSRRPKVLRFVAVLGSEAILLCKIAHLDTMQNLWGSGLLHVPPHVPSVPSVIERNMGRCLAAGRPVGLKEVWPL